MSKSFLPTNSLFKPACALSLFLLLSTTACTPSPVETDNAANPSDGLDPAVEEPIETDTAAINTTFAISGNGFQLITDDTGASQSFEFGTEDVLAQAALTTLWGEPQQSAENEECPAGSMTIHKWANGFSLNTQSGKFVGWSIDPRDAGSESLTTIDGVGIGSKLNELDPDAEITPDASIGIEFYTGEFSGLLDADSAEATILNLWSGTNCIFR